MKELKMFMFAGCPHCKKADEMISALMAERPEYKEVPFVRIDERKDPATVDRYDYYYVPSFFVGDEKIAEGVPTKENIEKAFAAAYRG